MKSENQNGPEGADNLSENKSSGIQSPANESYQQSRYIAAIGLSLGLTGLISPVTETRNGVSYEFDFYHPESEILIKILGNTDKHSWDKYKNHPDEPFIILDGHSSEFEEEECPCCDRIFLHSKDEMSIRLYEYEGCYVFYDDDLWEKLDHAVFGRVWGAIKPFVVRRLIEGGREKYDE